MFTNRWILLDLNRMAKYFRQSFLTYRQEKDKLYLICLQYFCYFSESDRKCQWLLLGLRQLTCKVTMTTICFHPLSLSLSHGVPLPRLRSCFSSLELLFYYVPPAPRQSQPGYGKPEHGWSCLSGLKYLIQLEGSGSFFMAIITV